LRGLPLSKTRLPLVMNNYPLTPTPTPTTTPMPYRYLYTFTSETSGNNPDFNLWGADRSTSCGTDCDYYQALVGSPYGNPSPAFDLWLQGVNGVGGAGPRQNDVSLSTTTNFEYSADVFVYNGQQDASYGLVFDASGSTFPGSGDPPIAPEYNYYILEMRIGGDKTNVPQWQFAKVKNGDRSGVTGLANLPITISERQWHNIKVIQQGTTMSFYLNGQFVGSGTLDSDWSTDRRRFGLYMRVRGTNGDHGPFEYFADNITVRDLP
jgi:hypothetical protein